MDILRYHQKTHQAYFHQRMNSQCLIFQAHRVMIHYLAVEVWDRYHEAVRLYHSRVGARWYHCHAAVIDYHSLGVARWYHCHVEVVWHYCHGEEAFYRCRAQKIGHYPLIMRGLAKIRQQSV